MTELITMTTKGTFTLPVAMRHKLGINAKGDKLAIELDELTQRIIISKPADLAVIHDNLKPYVEKTKSLTDVAGYYKSRKPRI